MEFFRRHFKQMVSYFYLSLLVFILQGCGGAESASTGDIPSVKEGKKESFVEEAAEEKAWAPSYELTEENLLEWEWVRKAETEDYYIVEQEDEERTYPQIVLKEGKEIFCGKENLNFLLYNRPKWDYSISYADRYYISLLYFDKETGEVEGSFVINMQCLVVERFINGSERLLYVQDDNDYKYGPWPSNGINLDFDEILEEIEAGNCRMDEVAYILWKENPEEFIESIRRQFSEIEKGGYEEAYCARYRNYWEDECKRAYRMYLREDGVGFYIHPMDYWEKDDEERRAEGDFRIEVAYDWKKSAPLYNMPYEVYGRLYEDPEYGLLYYPQIKGLDETVTDRLNEAMEKDLSINLGYMNREEWNEKMKPYGYEEYWEKMPSVGNPMVTYQTERYLCIRQELIMDEDEVLRFAEEWKRYHVYDLETGKSLWLEDIISLDRDFIRWLKEEKKVEARCGWAEGMRDFDVMVEYMKTDLEDYPEELLLSILEDAEFWMKDGSLYIRLPYYDQMFETIQYTGGGSGHPYYIAYTEARIAVEDLEGFLKVEPW